MTRNKRFLLAAAVAGATALTSLSAEAFFGPFNMMRGWGGGPWGWGGGPWGWGGYPYYGGWGGYPYWGGWGGYPYGGGWGGYPYGGGWGYPYYGYGWGAPYLGYPVVAAPAAVTAPASTSEK